MLSPGRLQPRRLLIGCIARPGNAGIAEEAECVPIGSSDIPGLVGFCRRERIDFVVVGPEAPLVLGLVDALEAEGIAPYLVRPLRRPQSKPKSSMKQLCADAGIPTAAHRSFRDPVSSQSFHRRARRADRRQSRWTCRGQRGHDCLL